MGEAVQAISRAKYFASRALSPKAYWYLMGKLKPVPAVTSEFETVDECLASGETVVALLNKLDVLDPAAVTLHIGAGLGRVEYHLRHHVSKCFGVDISGSMVKRARKLVPYGNVEFVQTDGTDLSHWSDGYFDLVYSFLVFQHLPRAQFHEYISEAFRKLSGSGHFVFHLMIDETGAPVDPPRGHPYGLRHYSRHDVEARLRSAGFTQVARTNFMGDPDDGSMAVGDVVFCAAKQ